MAMTDFFFALRRFARELRDTNSGDPVTRGELAGFFDALVTEGSTVTEVVTGNPQELGSTRAASTRPENNVDRFAVQRPSAGCAVSKDEDAAPLVGNPQELGGEDYPGNPFDVPENNDDDERHTDEPDGVFNAGLNV